MLITNNKIRHDQYCLPNLTGLEATAICLYLQNHRRLLFVSAYLLPTSILPLSDLDSIFTQHDLAIPVGDLNSKHAAWHNMSGNRNSRILPSYCVNKDITLNYPDQPTHFPHNSTPSVLDITFSKRCPTSKPQAVPTLSSEHNPIVFKILLHPLITKPRTLYDYKHANWSLFCTSLDLSVPFHPPSLTTSDLEHAVTTFETSVRQAAASSIPTQTVKKNHLTLPPTLRVLLKLKNHYQRRYQQSRLHIYHHVYTFFTLALSTQHSQLRNTKWTSFLRTLHPQSSQFWKMTRYFKTPHSLRTPSDIPRVTNLSNPPQSRDTGLTVRAIPPSPLNMGSNTRSLTVTRHVNRFFRSISPQIPLQELNNHYEVWRKSLSLKPSAAPGDDGITSIMLRHLSLKALLYLTRLFNHPLCS